MGNTLKVALAGAGAFGTKHLDAIRQIDGVEVVSLVGRELDKTKDVVRFASLGTTEQGDSHSQFRVDYLKPSSAIGFYYPDWVLVQKTRWV